MKLPASFILFVFLFSSCIEEYDLKINEAEPRLVVEGLITNTPGPHYIRLTKSETGSYISTVKNTTQNAIPVKDATVIITDDYDQIDTLSLIDVDDLNEYQYDYMLGTYKLIFNQTGEIVDTLIIDDPEGFVNRGYYKTTRLKGIPGHTYSLQILYNNKVYSSHAYMPPIPEIDSLGYLKRIAEKDGQEYFIPLLYFTEPQGIDNFYLIQLQNDIFSRHGYRTMNWQFSILSDEFLEPYVNGLYVSLGANPSGIEYDTYWFGDSIYVGLSSLTKEAYCYYKALLDQFDNDGGAYKPSPASPPGNISNGGLGLFRASAVSEKSIKIPNN
ncbi:MAG: DUF4249 domain-containing protein [Prolixibacteraceae bacterium]